VTISAHGYSPWLFKGFLRTTFRTHFVHYFHMHLRIYLIDFYCYMWKKYNNDVLFRFYNQRKWIAFRTCLFNVNNNIRLLIQLYQRHWMHIWTISAESKATIKWNLDMCEEGGRRDMQIKEIRYSSWTIAFQVISATDESWGKCFCCNKRSLSRSSSLIWIVGERLNI
jgi:hypothetical protein